MARKANQEPRTKNQEPRTKNQEPRTKNQEPRTKNQEQGTKPNQPFFLYYAIPAPHAPWATAPAFKGKSGAGQYGDYVINVDAMIGQVLATLDKLKLSENTLVLFSSEQKNFFVAEADQDGVAAPILKGNLRSAPIAFQNRKHDSTTYAKSEKTKPMNQDVTKSPKAA